MRRTQLVLLTVTLAILLNGCVQAPSNSTIVLPTRKIYDAEKLNLVAKEMSSNACPTMATLIVDYGYVRDEILAMQNAYSDN